MPAKILILNGPNLNLLGTREPEIYGHQTLADIEALCAKLAASLSIVTDFRQSNHEGELVDWIQASRKGFVGVIINPGALTHTSIALLDALLALTIPVIEVHLSNIYRREEFRQHSFISRAATGVICGFGSGSYVMAMQGMAQLLHQKGEPA